MLGSLFIGPTATLVDAALTQVDGARADGTVAVVGPPRLARALSERGRSVVAVSAQPRSLKRLRESGVYAAPGSLPVADGTLAAVVGVGAGSTDHWEELVREWSRAVADGGCVVLVDRGSPSELTRRALCGGRAADGEHDQEDQERIGANGFVQPADRRGEQMTQHPGAVERGNRNQVEKRQQQLRKAAEKGVRRKAAIVPLVIAQCQARAARAWRSEERRGGKECRSRWSPEH